MTAEPVQVARDEQLVELPIAEISPGKLVTNDRKRFDRQALEELASSISERGLIEPIIVRPVEPDGPIRYEVAAGERRFRAVSQVLGLSHVKAIVREMTDAEVMDIMLIENLAREDLNPIEEAEAYAKRMSPNPMDEEIVDLAQRVGTSVKRIRRRLLLLDLIDEARSLVATGELPVSERDRDPWLHGEILADLKEPLQRQALQFLVQNGGIGLKRFRRYVSGLREHDDPEMFTGLFQAQVIDNPLPPWGSDVELDVPDDDAFAAMLADLDLPTGNVFEQYVARLIEGGHDGEAKAVGSLYRYLVHTRRLARAKRMV